ncbi:MAG: hypothetical protein KA297_02740 [Kofleriaceae bacterium]|nr:hypothetical protein [Kofleriaceae bacterium]MBP6840634.1 hypothetical protein [Kofleriaceae bacterium]
MRATTVTASLLTSLLTLGLGACASDDTSDELAGETAGEDGDGKADSLDESGYHVARRVVARCLEPECRGVELTRLNRTTTPCLDGASPAACLVPDPALDWSGSGLSKEQIDQLIGGMPYGPSSPDAASEAPILIRGKIDEGRFLVTEAWLGADRAAPVTGIAVRVRGVRAACGSGSCPRHLSEAKLNSTRTATLGGLDFTGDGLDGDSANFLEELIFESGGPGVIITGTRTELADGSKSRSIDNYWLKVFGDNE